MSRVFNDIAEAAGRIAVAFRAAPPGVPQQVWGQLQPWLQQFVINAAGKWLPRVTAAFPCQVPVYRQRVRVGSCQNHAVAVCDVCGRSACLDHCRVDQFGDAICYICVMEAMQRRDAAGEPPPPNRGHAAWDRGGSSHASENGPDVSQVDAATVRAAYRMLGVKQSATDKELKSALRQKLGRWHPDKFENDTKAKQVQAAKRFKEIKTAYDVIQHHRQRDKAAA
jgi:hypothetical protein